MLFVLYDLMCQSGEVSACLSVSVCLWSPYPAPLYCSVWLSLLSPTSSHQSVHGSGTLLSECFLSGFLARGTAEAHRKATQRRLSQHYLWLSFRLRRLFPDRHIFTFVSPSYFACRVFTLNISKQPKIAPTSCFECAKKKTTTTIQLLECHKRPSTGF